MPPVQISTKLGTKHPWVKGTQVCSNERPCPFPRGDNYEIAKILWQTYKKNLLLRNHWINFNLTCTMHPSVEGTQVCSELFNSHKVNTEFFLLLINFVIIICVYRFSWSIFSGKRSGPWAYCFILERDLF